MCPPVVRTHSRKNLMVGLGTGQGLLADTSAFAGGTVADGCLPDPTFVRGL